jgi:Cu2+-exporting ATPase
MSGSTVIVTVNALLLKRLKLPAQQSPAAPHTTAPVPVSNR